MQYATRGDHGACRVPLHLHAALRTGLCLLRLRSVRLPFGVPVGLFVFARLAMVSACRAMRTSQSVGDAQSPAGNDDRAQLRGELS